MKAGSFGNRFGLLLFLLGFATAPAGANPRLPHLFSDHMVVQRDVPIHVWGWADPGEAIRVTLGDSSAETSARANGEWSIQLPARTAGGPFLLEIRGKTTLVIKDVLIGEVWIASGQSNMTYALSGAATAAEALPKANDPELRFFTVPKRISLSPVPDTLDASWEICTTDRAKNFSAVGYFFARDLRRSLKVPVGVILTAWPGTAAEEWTPLPALQGAPVLQPIVARWDAVPADEKQSVTPGAKFSLEFDDFELLPTDPSQAPVRFSKFETGSSEVSSGGSWEYFWQDAPASSFALVNPGKGGKGYAAKISGVLDGASDSRWEVRFHSDDSTEDLSAYSGVRFWVRGAGAFQFQTLQPTISDWDNYEAKLSPASPEWKQVTILFKDLKQEGWGVKEPLTLDHLLGFSISAWVRGTYPPRPPAGLYLGMITPLVGYPMRGAIWYQGESNTERAFQYRTLLPAMIQGWRAAWHEPDFPFLIVQLPNQGSTAELVDSWWAELREAQLFTFRNVPNTGLAVTLDVGEASNLHPPRKEEVGNRLALWALAKTYGEKIEFSGPLYAGMKVEGNAIRVQFQYAEGGLELKDGGDTGFTIAGGDRKFHHATARIDGDTMVVSSPEVGTPVSVRYAWADSPVSTLFNKAGLPASPFRTDDWPGATFSKR